MGSTKDMDQLVKRLKKLNVPVRSSNSSHWIVECPNGGTVVISRTPSSWRTLRNTKADLQRNGIRLNNNGDRQWNHRPTPPKPS